MIFLEKKVNSVDLETLSLVQRENESPELGLVAVFYPEYDTGKIRSDDTPQIDLCCYNSGTLTPVNRDSMTFWCDNHE